MVLDGTLLPCWTLADARELYSGKNKTTGHSRQVLADLSGQLNHISDPLVEKHHDTYALREKGLSDSIDFPDLLAD
ncbi:hypothetical protein [Rathayibacter toxicus]|uniref:hypothetical protein n=1 Tax=Rathayibacter toxicus TaxID=145458 RepID=UPI001C053126|nr:hypothetical protein [Rathayibacter toxicus]QWL30643.1 hypothetical protein E2R34_07810 [Rathayibacter toxicus]